MRILICDDDKLFVDRLKCDIIRFFSSLNKTVNVSCQYDGFDSIQKVEFDVVFMDIELKTKDGIELAGYMKEINPNIIIIFISNRDDLVFKALSVDMFQFIRKVNYTYDLMIVLRQLVRYFERNSRSVLLMTSEGEKTVYIKDIEYLLSVGHEVVVKCKNEDVIQIGSLTRLLEKINDDDIVQIQKGLAINLRCVERRIKTNVICDSGEYVIGRSYKANFITKYQEFLLR